MSETRRRAILYVSGVVLAAGLLFAGFGITIPPDPGARLSGAVLIAGLGDTDEAIATCEKVIEEHPDNVPARVYKATFLAQAERFDEALAAYDDALGHVGDDRGLARKVGADRASVLLHAGRIDEFRSARDALARDGVDAPVHLLDGLAARKDRDLPAAEAAFLRVLAEDPQNDLAKSLLIEVLGMRGEEAVAKGDFAGAQAAYVRARGVAERRGDIALKLAEVHLARERPGDAMVVLDGLGRLRGVAPLAFRSAGMMLEGGKRTQALAALAVAHAADAKETAALFESAPAWKAARARGSLAVLLESRNETEQGEAICPSPGG